jgi:septal ring factor EnvC (AmiA/AmiB activator)
MAAAEALLAYEPLQQLQHENFLLREKNRQFQSEVRELLAWKDKAVAHMAAMAPARRRAAREVERAKQLQQQLRAVESSLKSRGVLELATTALEAERDTLEQRVEALKRENAALRLQGERRKRRADEAEAQLAAMGESFRLHLERLVAMRERLDEASGGGSKSQPKTEDENQPAQVTASNRDNGSSVEGDPSGATGTNQDPATAESEGASSASSPSVPVDSAALVTGLDAVATKCLSWLQEHLAQSFARQQRKAARYEAQHEELKRLEAQVQAAGRIPERLADEHAKQARELTELREAHELLQQRAADAEQTVIVQQQRREDMATRLRLVAGEVRQYLRLVRGEIKRKFGYLPEAIAHAESWARIAEALELLLCQGTDRCVARGRRSSK